MIAEYAEALAGRLGYDRMLSRAVRDEVEDHLWEAAAAEATGDPLEAQRRAIARFGDAQAVARQIAVVALARSARRIGVAAMLVIAVTFVAMYARLSSYGAAGCLSADEIAPVANVVASIDRCAFGLAVCAALIAWLYVSRARAPVTYSPAYGRHVRRFLMLCWLAAGTLVASVAADAALTSLRLSAAAEAVNWSIAVASMAVEIACAAMLVGCLHRMARRVALVARTT